MYQLVLKELGSLLWGDATTSIFWGVEQTAVDKIYILYLVHGTNYKVRFVSAACNVRDSPLYTHFA